MTVALILLAIAAVVVLTFVLRVARTKNIDIIVRANLARKRDAHTGLRHVFFLFVDHYEPLWKGADEQTGLERVDVWLRKYAESVDGFRDNGGRAPQHTFFYPEEEYRPQYLDMLGQLCREGYGDVEIHLHHDNDTSQGFRDKIMSFKETLHERHGFLQRNPDTGEIDYAFIHGNWALDDSGADGRWCGVRDEITILKETGCYADFTYPSAPHPTQPPVINQIYYCTDDPQRAKSHHRGTELRYGSGPLGDLLMVTGPLAINWKQRRRGIFPAIENGDITGNNTPSADRVDLWMQTGVTIRDWPRWVFVKIHTHGAQEHNAQALLGPAVRPLYENLLGRYNDGENYMMHFVTAREAYTAIKAAESGDSDAIQRVESFDYTQPSL